MRKIRQINKSVYIIFFLSLSACGSNSKYLLHDLSVNEHIVNPRKYFLNRTTIEGQLCDTMLYMTKSNSMFFCYKKKGRCFFLARLRSNQQPFFGELSVVEADRFKTIFQNFERINQKQMECTPAYRAYSTTKYQIDIYLNEEVKSIRYRVGCGFRLQDDTLEGFFLLFTHRMTNPHHSVYPDSH